MVLAEIGKGIFAFGKQVLEAKTEECNALTYIFNKNCFKPLTFHSFPLFP